MKTKGITIEKKIRKIGMMASDTGLIHFDDVRVPQRYRIGEEGKGFTYQMLQFQEERLWAAAASIESLMRTLNDTIEYIGERKMFGRTVLDFQYVHYRLAELKTEIEALRQAFSETHDIASAVSIARERGMSKDQLRQLIVKHTAGRQLGFLGEPRVNVLELNLDLDEHFPAKKQALAE